MSEENYIEYEDMLPDGSFPLCGFRILSYLSPEGNTCYKMNYSGEVAVSQLIGLIEMAKHDLTSAAVDTSRKKGE